MNERTPAQRRALVGLGLVVVGAIVAAIIIRPAPEEIEEIFKGSGAVGPLLFVGAYALLTVAALPASPMTIAAGALYGVAAGASVSVVGATSGAIAAFLLARHLTGEAKVGGGEEGRLAALRERLEGRGLLALLAIRLVPVVPFNALNYAAAASNIGFRDYSIATALGIIPGTLLYAAIGAGLDNPFSTLFIGAAAAAIVIAVLANRYSHKIDPAEGQEPVEEAGG